MTLQPSSRAAAPHLRLHYFWPLFCHLAAHGWWALRLHVAELNGLPRSAAGPPPRWPIRSL